MDAATSPTKKLKSPVLTGVLNTKTSVTCTNVPEGLFDTTASKKHFTKFGRVQKIRLFPKKQMCIVEYDQPSSAEKAVLNAGAFEGSMFDVTRTKPRIRKRSKKEDDPDWVPDSDVEEELAAMSGAPSYRFTRQKPMELESDVKSTRVIKKIPVVKKPPNWEKAALSQPISGIESPVSVAVTQTTMGTLEAATELHQLRSKISLTPDEQWRTLDARDRILRAWGGTGCRVKVGGATIGTCPDMCPEKELLHRQAEHQVLTLETVLDSDGQMEPWRAVKQYSRSSADQEIPMCYELRPATVLMRTCAYLLHEIADTKRQVTLADWFHFMWDRFRGIRKDITQQALCCAESIRLVEMCARFHAHCAARLADLEHTQFDQKLNTDNLTKCLQTLKHMYADVGAEQKPREAEFRGYIALLNLGDANFWWEIKQLPQDIQKSEALIFAIQVFNALDNNNYVRFFRLVKDKATYLQACILLRYFNDVRARALARIVKAFAPRGGSRYPAEDLMNALAFESVESMKSFINHYGLRFAKVDDSELTVILDRNQFIEDSDPYPVARAVTLIESKRLNSVGEVIAGGVLPPAEFRDYTRNSSYTSDGRLKEASIIAEDQGYNTINDSNKDVRALKAELLRLLQGGRSYGTVESRSSPWSKSQMKAPTPDKGFDTIDNVNDVKKFMFQPAIPVAPTEIIHKSPEKIFQVNNNSKFIFSKPQEPVMSNIFEMKPNSLFSATKGENNKAFGMSFSNKDAFKSSNESKSTFSSLVTKTGNRLFGQPNDDINKDNNSINIFGKGKDETNFVNPESISKSGIVGSIFTKPTTIQEGNASSIFANFNKTTSFKPEANIFSKPNNADVVSGTNSSNNMSPGSLFKSACNPTNGSEPKAYCIFQTKNKEKSVAADIFKSVTQSDINSVYEFDLQEELNKKMEEEQECERRLKENERLQEQRRQEELRKEELRRQEEERKKQEEIKRLEEKRRKEEERKQEELRKKIEEERKAEIKRKQEEEKRIFTEKVEKESIELVEQFIDEINSETVSGLLKDELEKFKSLMMYADTVTGELISELCNEVCRSEMTAEKFLTNKLRKKWFSIWRSNFVRNYKRRSLLENTPVWLSDNTPLEEAHRLRRLVENAALKNMNAIHRGYRFTGELKQLPSPQKYNIMEIIKSPLLKRMKNINYPYDKCFFWKLTLVAPKTAKWLCKKVDVEKWLLDAFSDRKKHDSSESLIHVQKQSWNNLIDFAISISLLTKKRRFNGEVVESSNALLFYFTESDNHFAETITETLKHKYPHQIIPVTVILPKSNDESMYRAIESLLANYLKENTISAFKLYLLEPNNVFDSLNSCTKSALKWMAKKYPQCPNLEIDYLKSICQRYLGNEIWCRLKYEKDGRMNIVLKDLRRLIKCYNTAVDKLTNVITDEDLFNYPPFPLEFKGYLDGTSPYPKPFEFIPSSARNAENISVIKDLMKQLILPDLVSEFLPVDVPNMQQQIRKYCNQIGWFENPEEVVCKVVAVLPNQFSNLDLPSDIFNQYFANYNFIDFLNVIVYEKICRLKNFDNRFAIYEKTKLEEYCNTNWLYEVDIMSSIKHKALEYDDDLDYFIEAKRRKIALDSMEHLMLEDKDATLVEENIKATEENISRYNNCEEAVKQLEKQLEEEKKKSVEFEHLLRIALSDV